MKKLFPSLVFVQALGAAGYALADNHALEETIVVGTQDSRIIQLFETVEVAADSAELLRKAPGANFNSNGPVTGIAQLRGMFGNRVGLEVNGQKIGSGGPNWMDPPLSYAPAAQLEVLEVFRGIAPVSAGQETIGGAIHATTWSGDFASEDKAETNGALRVGGQSVNSASLVNAAVAIANQQHKFSAVVLDESASNAEFPYGEIAPSEYARQRIDAGYAFKQGEHQFELKLVRSETGDAGTPALPMDIEYIDSDLASLSYQLESNSLSLNAMVYGSDIEHSMTNYHLRTAPMMASMWRRNVAIGSNSGLKLSARANQWTFGVDYHSEEHDSDIDNPNADMFFVVNFNEATRDVLGAFAEYDYAFSSTLDAEFGLRVNRVSMDSGDVNGTPAMMMPAAETLRDNFNSANKQKNDTNVDLVAKIFSQYGENIKLYAGIAQKTRSPSYQERYLWLPLEATGGLADGRTYTGNINLKPEVANELELGFDYESSSVQWSPRLFYRDVKDYIQGTVSTNMPAVMFSNMMGMSPEPPLEFNNVDARLYGFDMDMRVRINDNIDASVIVNYVRGERDDIQDDLYRIAPLNASIALTYTGADWGLTGESILVAKQQHVSQTQSEKETAGYGLFNVKAHWKPTQKIQLGAGIDNLLDKHYENHLAGYNRVMGSDIAVRDRLPGYGRNVYLRLDYKW